MALASTTCHWHTLDLFLKQNFQGLVAQPRALLRYRFATGGSAGLWDTTVQTIPGSAHLADKAFIDASVWVSSPQASLVIAGGSQACAVWANVTVPEWPANVGLANMTGIVFSCTAC